VAEPSQERLDQLEERIDDVRREAEDDGLLPDRDPEPTLYDPNPGGPDRPSRIGNDQVVPPG
jgi:hypothetical protein